MVLCRRKNWWQVEQEVGLENCTCKHVRVLPVIIREEERKTVPHFRISILMTSLQTRNYLTYSVI